MKFMRKQLQVRRPLAAKQDCTIEGVEYKKHEYINSRKHRYYFLRRAFIQKKIGHPVEGYKQPEGFGLQKEDKTVQIVDKGRGWFDVEVNGETVNDKSLREDDAKVLAESL